MAAAGFRGKQFNALPRVRQLRAERRLLVAQAAMHERLGSEVEGFWGLGYDILLCVVQQADKCFRDVPAHNQVLKRWKTQQVGRGDGHGGRTVERVRGEAEEERHAALQNKAAAVVAHAQGAAYAQELAETKAQLVQLRSAAAEPEPQPPMESAVQRERARAALQELRGGWPGPEDGLVRQLSAEARHGAEAARAAERVAREDTAAAAAELAAARHEVARLRQAQCTQCTLQ